MQRLLLSVVWAAVCIAGVTPLFFIFGTPEPGLIFLFEHIPACPFTVRSAQIHQSQVFTACTVKHVLPILPVPFKKEFGFPFLLRTCDAAFFPSWFFRHDFSPSVSDPKCRRVWVSPVMFNVRQMTRYSKKKFSKSSLHRSIQITIY